MNGEIGVASGKAGNEMILERADRAFGCIASMNMRRRELEINLLIGQIVFEEL